MSKHELEVKYCLSSFVGSRRISTSGCLVAEASGTRNDVRLQMTSTVRPTDATAAADDNDDEDDAIKCIPQDLLGLCHHIAEHRARYNAIKVFVDIHGWRVRSAFARTYTRLQLSFSLASI